LAIDIFDRNGRRRFTALAARWAAPLLLAVLAACSSAIVGGPNISTSRTGEMQAVPAGTDPEDEVIGRREHPRIVASYGGVYDDRKAQIMVAQIVSRLLEAADQPENSFTITILDSPQVNAFALPGGYIYVTRGILALANDSSELAAVLAHEIAHVTLRHARARSRRVATSELVNDVISGVFGEDPNATEVASRSRMSLAAFSQGQELEADEEGVRIAGSAGFDPHAAGRFLAAMNRFSEFASGEEAPGDDFLSSHPSTPNRIERAVEVARTFGPPGTGVVNRAGYLAAIKGLTFGESPARGAIVGQRFVHPMLDFTFTVPDRFELQNSQSAVVAVAGDGEAVRFDSAEVPPSMALTDYLNSGWIAGLDPDSVRAERHNGVDMASGRARTEQWAFRVTAVRFDGEVYRFIFAARSETEAFRQAAEQTVASFRAATAADERGISTASIDLVTARAGDTADRLAARMGGIADARRLFFILNDLYPGDPVEAGRQYKIVTLD